MKISSHRDETRAWLIEEEGSGLLKKLPEDIDGFRRETGLARVNFTHNETSRADQLNITPTSSAVPTPEKQTEWLKDVSNRLVTVLRQRIAEVVEEGIPKTI